MGEVKAINNIHRILLGAAFTGGALFAVSLTTDGAAHADDKPAAVAEHPGGLLDAVTGTVDQVTADEPKPEPADEPAIDLPPVEVPVDVPPVVIDPLPVVVPTPTPPTPTLVPQQPTVQLPVEAVEPAATLPAQAVVAPAELPVLIGPLPGRTLDDGIRPAALPEPPICDDRNDEPRRIPGGEKQHRRIHTTPDRAAGQPHPGRPCPNTPSNPSQANTTPSVKPPPPTGEQLVAISAAGAYSRPVLHRLTQMRARSDLPAGRTEHPEPGPA